MFCYRFCKKFVRTANEALNRVCCPKGNTEELTKEVIPIDTKMLQKSNGSMKTSKLYRQN